MCNFLGASFKFPSTSGHFQFFFKGSTVLRFQGTWLSLAQQVPMAQTPTSATSFEQKLHKYLRMLNEFSHKTSWYPDLKKLEVSIETFSHTPNPSVTFSFKVIEELCNEARILHGGCAVLLVDDLTTVLLGAVSKPGLFSRFGVSKSLSATFIRPLSLGDEARIVSELEYFGKRRAVLRAKLYRVEGNELCAILENDRANTDPHVSSKI